MRYGKIFRFAVWLLGGAIFLYGAANVVLGLWGFPAEPLPRGCPDVADLPLPAPMPTPDLIFTAPEKIGIASKPAATSDACPLIAAAVLSNGAHTDFLLPAVLTPPGEATISWPDIFPVPPELTAQTANLYVYIGWGEREFYLNTPNLSDVRISLLLKAALGGTAAWWWTRPQPVSVEVHAVARGLVEDTLANTRAGEVESCQRARMARSKSDWWVSCIVLIAILPVLPARRCGRATGGS